MRKEYVKPTAEKINFDYVESVVACPSGCADPGHSWHAGSTYPSCYGSNVLNKNNNNNNNGNNNNQGQNGTNPYYAPGWGLGCS